MSRRFSLVTSNPTLLDFGLVEKGISAHIGASESRDRAFAVYVLTNVFGLDASEVEVHIVDGGGDRGVDLIYIDHERRVINIGSCKVVATFKKSNRNFPGAEVDKIISFIDDIMFKNETIVNFSNGFVAAKVRQIWEILEADPYDVHVHLFSNQLTLADAERGRLQIALQRHRVKLLEHGLYELSHGSVRAARPRFRKKLEPVKGKAYNFCQGEGRGIVMTVSLPDIFKFLSLDGTNDFDERLLEQNVRYFLGLDNAVNNEIRQTLVSKNIEEFWYLNNGLTIVCDQIIGLENGCHPLTLVNPLIVNGGQTACVIHSVGVSTLKGISAGAVSIKLIETKNAAFIKEIAIASNTQSRIFGRDLRANDHIQGALAASLAIEGYFYMRKRGERAPSDAKDTIDAARIGQIILSYVHGDPVKSKTNSNSIFEELYDYVFDPAIVNSEVVLSCHLLFKEVDRIRLEALAYQASVERNTYSETWIIEGYLHLLFVVGELLRRRRVPITDVKGAIEIFPEALALIGEFVRSHPRVAAYRLFRSTSSKDALIRLIDGVSPGRPFQLGWDF